MCFYKYIFEIDILSNLVQTFTLNYVDKYFGIFSMSFSMLL